MSPPLEQDYIGLSETTPMVERSSEKISSSSSSSSSSNTLCTEEDGKRNVLNLKETELRLGLPGSHSPERKSNTTTPCGLSLFGKEFEDKTKGFSLVSAKIPVSGAKRGFSDAINGSGKWGFSMTGGSNADFAKVDSTTFTPNAGDGGGKNINTLQSCLPGAKAKEVGAPSSAAKPTQGKSAPAEKESGSAPASK